MRLPVINTCSGMKGANGCGGAGGGGGWLRFTTGTPTAAAPRIRFPVTVTSSRGGGKAVACARGAAAGGTADTGASPKRGAGEGAGWLGAAGVGGTSATGGVAGSAGDNF